MTNCECGQPTIEPYPICKDCHKTRIQILVNRCRTKLIGDYRNNPTETLQSIGRTLDTLMFEKLVFAIHDVKILARLCQDQSQEAEQIDGEKKKLFSYLDSPVSGETKGKTCQQVLDELMAEKAEETNSLTPEQ